MPLVSRIIAPLMASATLTFPLRKSSTALGFVAIALAEQRQRGLTRAFEFRERLAQVALHAVLGGAHVVGIGQAEVEVEALLVRQEFRLMAWSAMAVLE